MKKSTKTAFQPQLKYNTEKLTSSSSADSKIILILIAYLLIDFLPYFKSIEIISPQFFYLSALNLLVISYVYLNPTYFSVSVLSFIKKSYVFWAYLVFMALCFLSIFGAKNVSLFAVSFVQILVVFGVFINLAVLLYNRVHLFYTLFFLVGVSAFFQTLQALIGLKEAAETQSLVAALESTYLRGNTGNINIFAASVLIKIPFILVGIAHFSGWKRSFLAATLALASMPIFLISARAALLSLSVIFIGFVIFYFRNYGSNKATIFRVILFFLLPMATAFFASNLILKRNNKGGRYTSTAERLKQIDVNSNDSSIKLRLLFWKNAVNFAKEKPVSGIGLGNWRVESIPYEPKGGLDISLHVHNDFLEIAAETGVVNGLVYLSLFFAVLLLNIRTLLKSADHQAKLFAFLALTLLVVYGADSLFNFPMYRPTMKIGFCIMLIITVFNRHEIEKPIIHHGNKIFLGMALLAIVPIYFTYHGFKTSQLEKSILLDNANIEQHLPTTLSGDSVIKFQPKYPNVLVTSESFVEHAAVYYTYEKRYEIAKKYLDSADKINPYLATTDFLRYYIAIENGKVDSAYSFMKRSFYKRPSVERNFRKAVEVASFKKDTLELFKIYHAIDIVNRKNANWDLIYSGLQSAGLSGSGLQKFISAGLVHYSNDSLIVRRQRDFKIFNFLVEGQRLFAVGKHAEALREYKKGLGLDSVNVFVMQNIGYYYYNLGQTDRAIEYLLKSLRYPGLVDGQTEFYLAQCYLKQNNLDKACHYMQIAKSIGFSGAAEAFGKFCK
ncbi:O-antigen ligase family protein [Pedobacter sp.]